MKENQDKEEIEENNEKPDYVALGMSLGMVIGVALGQIFFDNVALGISIGLMVGVSIGVNIKNKNEGEK